MYDTIKLVPVYAIICTLKEILRAKKVFKGLEEGRNVMPQNGSLLFIPVLIATLKGNGSGFAGPIVRFFRYFNNFASNLKILMIWFFRGDWQSSNQEVLKPSIATKLCFVSAILLTLVHDQELIYLGMVGTFIAIKLAGIFGEPVDPFKPLEAIIFGTLSTVSFEGRVKLD